MTLITAVAWLPGVRVLGLSAVVTAVVYCGDTASTVMGLNVTDVVWPPDVPVTVTVYCVGGKPALAKGELAIDWKDEVFAGAVLTHDGQIKHEATRKSAEG